MRLVLLALLGGLSGCGYGLVRASDGAARVGLIEDTSSEATLGRHARRALIGRIGEAPAEAPEITGRIRVLPEEPLAIDGLAARYRVIVELDAGAEVDGGRWQRRVRGEATFLRGPSTAETLLARRAALRVATERSAGRWWAHWIERTRR